MTFLAPALLALGLAVAVPLALHLFQRHHAPRVVFPAVRYLRRAEREHATRLRLRQLLLLGIRVLAILLITAAAAQPFLPMGGRDHHPTSVVIILDNSMASGAIVGDRRILDHLKDAALETVRRAGPDDRLWLIRAGEPWEPAFAGGIDAVASAVRQTEPSAGDARIDSLVERAASILATEPDHRASEIHLLSDLRATALAAASTALASPGAARLVVLEPPARLASNRAITSLEVGGGLPPRAGAPTPLSVGVRAFGALPEDTPDSVDVRLVVEGTIHGVARVPVGAAATLVLPGQEPGLVTGRVEIDADALAADDRRHFVIEVRPAPLVWLVEALPFLDEAAGVLEDAGRIRRTATGPGDIIVAPGALGAEAIQRGAGVIVMPPATPFELAAANRRLDAAGLPWRLGPPGPGEARLDPDDTGLEWVLAEVRLRQVYPLEQVAESDDTVLVRLRTGEPWAVAGATGTGRYVILGTPMTEDGSTIPTSAAMLPLLDRAINVWVAGAADRVAHRPGDIVAIAVGDSIIRPGGGADPVRPGSVYRLTEAGVYRVFGDGAMVAAFAVNPPPTASDVRSMPPRDAADRLAGRDARTVSAQAWGDTVFQHRIGSDLAIPLLVAAVLLLVLEAAFAATGRAAARQDPA